MITQSKKVNLFIIGQPKSGTTALYYYLKQHPQIYLPKQKQLHHFAADFNTHRQQFKRLTKKIYRKYYNYSFEDYLDHFNFQRDIKYYCDITPDYFYSADAPQKIHNYNPEAKIIAIIREPISFLHSMHSQLVYSGYEKEKNFSKALQLEEIRLLNKKVKQSKICPNIFFSYSKLVNYIKYIRRYYEYFGDNFKIIIYEDFKHNNNKYLNLLYRFLNLDTIRSLSEVCVNPRREIKNNFLYKVKFLYPVRIIISIMPGSVKSVMKSLFINMTTHKLNSKQKNQLILEDLKILKDRFAINVKETDEFLKKNNLMLNGRTLNLNKFWGYDN